MKLGLLFSVLVLASCASNHNVPVNAPAAPVPAKLDTKIQVGVVRDDKFADERYRLLNITFINHRSNWQKIKSVTLDHAQKMRVLQGEELATVVDAILRKGYGGHFYQSMGSVDLTKWPPKNHLAQPFVVAPGIETNKWIVLEYVSEKPSAGQALTGIVEFADGSKETHTLNPL